MSLYALVQNAEPGVQLSLVPIPVVHLFGNKHKHVLLTISPHDAIDSRQTIF